MRQTLKLRECMRNGRHHYAQFGFIVFVNANRVIVSVDDFRINKLCAQGLMIEAIITTSNAEHRTYGYSHNSCRKPFVVRIISNFHCEA